ncbi:larval cuticle protein A2B-like [Battus philenor]|uniref:larval cuticle protein A2B-like n=1 Tax=Battus philenor TaxID=42288 RepID=UPI0035D119C9
MLYYVLIACLLAITAAAPYNSYGLASVDSYSVPKYEFNYAVNDPHTGDNKAQSEVRDGDVVKGSYSLAEPDGTIRIVEYTADAVSGFNAVVKRIGQSAHPQQIITPVLTKAVAQPMLTQAPLIASDHVSNVGYSLEDYWPQDIGWGGHSGIGEHGYWH